jgi:hypothetical protein
LVPVMNKLYKIEYAYTNINSWSEASLHCIEPE